MHFHFLSVRRKHVEERMSFDSSSSLMLDVVSYGLNHLDIFYNASILKHKKRKCISWTQRCHNLSCLLKNCKNEKTLLSEFDNEFRILFLIYVHENPFVCIWMHWNWLLFQICHQEKPLMEVTLLANMRIEVRFDQGPSMNGINFKIICRWCRKNVFKDPDDDDDRFVSSFGTLDDVLLSL